ncbi:MAG: triose-phosphate isomerase [bacterium]|nr:triose-phosphate isomerase [bacterium]
MKALVVANWKMNPPTFREAKKLLETTRKAADATEHVTLVVAPPAIFLRELRARHKGKKIAFALQNASAEESGAYTGEISLAQGADAGATYAIVGHAERRAMGESSDDTQKKVAAALAANMTPILCVGEATRTASAEYFGVVKEQLRIGLADISSSQLGSVIISYEPVWAIGGEKTMSPRDMHEMAIFIRKTVVELHGEKGMGVKIIYGGAATESNAANMLRDGDVDGLLVGHVSVDAPRFAALLQAIEDAT